MGFDFERAFLSGVSVPLPIKQSRIVEAVYTLLSMRYPTLQMSSGTGR